MSFITSTALLNCIQHPEDTYEILARAATSQSPWTEIRIHREADRVWAQYHSFPFLMRKIIGDKVTDSLESYQIDLNDPKNDCFSVYHLYRDFSNSTQDPVSPVSMNRYLKEVEKEDPRIYPKGDSSIQSFKSAEAAMVKALLENDKSDSIFFHPIPCGNDGVLDKVIYLIFDRAILDEEQKAAIDAFPLVI